jgi:hypothetical protein
MKNKLKAISKDIKIKKRQLTDLLNQIEQEQDKNKKDYIKTSIVKTMKDIKDLYKNLSKI